MKYRLFTALMLLASSAQAETTFYGQVNKLLLWSDDVNGDRVVVSDNAVSSTRFGFKAEHEVGAGLTASVLLEGELDDNDRSRSTDNTTIDAPSAAPAGFEERHARVGLSGDYGTLLLGRTSTATDGITELDTGGTTDIMYSDLAAIGGGLDANPTGTTDSFNTHYSNLEGVALNSSDRVNLVRYDTPVFNGLQAAAAFANGGDFDLALRYNGKVDDFTIRAGLGYVNLNQSGALGEVTQWSGSISAKHASGVNFTLGYGERDVDNSALEPEMIYAKLGYDVGRWAFAADYGSAENVAVQGVEAFSYGLGAQYNFTSGVASGLLLRQLEIDRPGVNNDPVRLVGLSLRVKF